MLMQSLAVCTSELQQYCFMPTLIEVVIQLQELFMKKVLKYSTFNKSIFILITQKMK